MSFAFDSFSGQSAATAPASDRLAFIRRTYGLLAVAILAFVGLEAALVPTIGMDVLKMLFSVKFGWLAVIGLCMLGSWVANSMAHSETSTSTQFAGLGLMVLIEAAIFLPLLALAEYKFPGEQIALKAGGMTLLVFGGLTASVFISGKDFSFMGSALTILGFAAMGLILFSIIFGMSLGIWFAFAMVGLASGYILYDTSNILHHYRTDQHVGAALALFSSVMLLFWYIIQIFMYSSED